MWLITKRGMSVRELSSTERALLRKYTEADQLPPQELREAASLLREIRADEHWIVCDCAKPGPVLTVVLKDTGRLGIRNNHTSLPHAASCPWIKQETASADRPKRSGGAGLVQIDAKQPLSLHAEFSGTKGADSSQISRSATSGTGGSRNKRLLSLLFSLMDAAGLMEYDPASSKSLTEQFKRMREVTARYRLGAQISLGGYFDTHLTKKDLYKMAMRLKSMPAQGGRKVGLLLDLVDGIRGRSIHAGGGQELPFFGHVEHEGKADAPLLCLATVTTQTAESKFFELGHVAYVAVLNRKTLLPVFSDPERAALDALVGLLDWMHTKHKRRVILRRDVLVGGHVIELVGRDRIVLVDLMDNGLDDRDVVAEEDEAVRLSLAGQTIEELKRRVARLFLRDSE